MLFLALVGIWSNGWGYAELHPIREMIQPPVYFTGEKWRSTSSGSMVLNLELIVPGEGSEPAQTLRRKTVSKEEKVLLHQVTEASAGGAPIKMISFVKSWQDEDEEVGVQSSPFEGLFLTFEDQVPSWKATAYQLENGMKKALPLTAEAEAEIMELAPEFNADYQSFLNDLPAEPVELGTSWKVVEAEVAAGLGNALQGLFSEEQVSLLKGDEYTLTMNLAEVGSDTLVFGLSGRVAVRGVAPEREMTVTFDLRDSKIVVRRGAYMVHSFRVNGGVTMSGFMVEEGTRIQLKGGGELTFTESNQR